MRHFKIIILLLTICFTTIAKAQNNNDYIEFNDRKNTVHGVYMGLGFHYGKIDKADTFLTSLKVAYVANQQFEIGFVGVGFYSDTNRQGIDINEGDIGGAYGGLHLEPILFSKSKLNLSFPVLIGGGAVAALLEDSLKNDNIDDDNWTAIFVVEPGVNILYNISRFIQFEAGIKYRFTSKTNLKPEVDINNINGFSAGLGIKVGIFNMGRNRYKKKIKK